jgi:hypothetical protein
MKRVSIAVLFGTAALSLTPLASYGQSASQGYVMGRDGQPIKQARTGECVKLVRTWSQAVETPACKDASMKANQSSQKR